jgi:hypothetical protein
MRIYIIGNDGITLCREPPAAVNEELSPNFGDGVKDQAAAWA